MQQPELLIILANPLTGGCKRPLNVVDDKLMSTAMLLLRNMFPKALAFAGVLVLSTGLSGTPATAGQVSPPPLVLSPNLTEPWMLQLQPQVQRRSTAQRYQFKQQRVQRPRVQQQQPQVRRANWWSPRQQPVRQQPQRQARVELHQPLQQRPLRAAKVESPKGLEQHRRHWASAQHRLILLRTLA